MNLKYFSDSRNSRISEFNLFALAYAILVIAFTAPSTIDDVFFPGSQDTVSGTFDSPSPYQRNLRNYNIEVESYFAWSGSMMAQAARNSLFEVCAAISNQDVPGGGDLCIRRHAIEGWKKLFRGQIILK